MNKSLIFVIGKTSSGKDTIVNYIAEKYGIKPIVSYTTRPKRENETNGVEHEFITKDMMASILENETMLAYVKFQKTEYEYCTTLECIKDDVMTYIIDPDGIRNFEKMGHDIDTYKIFVHLSEVTIKERAKNRGDAEEDIISRLASERSMFDYCLMNQDYDYIISTNQSKEDVFADVDYVMSKIRHKINENA